MMQRRLTMTGSTLRARPVAEKAAIAAELRTHVWPLLESGAVRPVIHATFPLRAAADAHRVHGIGRAHRQARAGHHVAAGLSRPDVRLKADATVSCSTIPHPCS